MLKKVFAVSLVFSAFMSSSYVSDDRFEQTYAPFIAKHYCARDFISYVSHMRALVTSINENSTALKDAVDGSRWVKTQPLTVAHQVYSLLTLACHNPADLAPLNLTNDVDRRYQGNKTYQDILKNGPGYQQTLETFLPSISDTLDSLIPYGSFDETATSHASTAHNFVRLHVLQDMINLSSALTNHYGHLVNLIHLTRLAAQECQNLNAQVGYGTIKYDVLIKEDTITFMQVKGFDCKEMIEAMFN